MTTVAYPISEQDSQQLETQVSYRRGGFNGLVQVTDSDGTSRWDFASLGQVANLGYKNPLNGGSSINDRAFQPAGDNKTYSMKLGRNDKILDPQTVLAPVLDQGWEVSDHKAIRGGIWFVTTLTHPDHTIEDFITWDLANFAEDNRHLVLKPSIQIQADLQKSSMYSVTAGLYRLVCLNGLVAEALGLGYMVFNAQTFNFQDLQRLASGAIRNSFDRAVYKRYPTPVIQKINGLLGGLHRGEQTLEALPSLLQSPVRRLVSDLSDSSQRALVDQLNLVAEAGIPTVTLMDILNAITNSSKNIRVLSNLNSMSSALNDLADLFAWTN